MLIVAFIPLCPAKGAEWKFHKMSLSSLFEVTTFSRKLLFGGLYIKSVPNKKKSNWHKFLFGILFYANSNINFLRCNRMPLMLTHTGTDYIPSISYCRFEVALEIALFVRESQSDLNLFPFSKKNLICSMYSLY